MGILVIAQPSEWEKRFLQLLVLLLVAGIMVLAASWAVERLRQPGEVWTAAQLAQAVKRGEVERLVIRGSQTLVETKTGTRARLHMEPQRPMFEVLRNLGVSEEKLTHIEVVFMPPPLHEGLLGRLLWWNVRLCGGIAILALLGFTAFVHARRSRQSVARSA